MFLLIFCDDACCSHNLTSSVAMPAQGWISPTQTRGEICFKERGAGGGGGYSPNGRGAKGGKNTNHIDRDSLPTVAHSIQYSWKCDTFPLQWMALTLKAILSTSTGCSFQSVIEFLKKVDLHRKGTALPCSVCRLRQDGSWKKNPGVILSSCHACVIKLTLFCPVLLADSWHSTRHAKHNPPTCNQIAEQNGI